MLNGMMRTQDVHLQHIIQGMLSADILTSSEDVIRRAEEVNMVWLTVWTGVSARTD